MYPVNLFILILGAVMGSCVTMVAIVLTFTEDLHGKKKK